jgi:hypothetical protein
VRFAPRRNRRTPLARRQSGGRAMAGRSVLRGPSGVRRRTARRGPCLFEAEADALTHARILLHRAPDGAWRCSTTRRAGAPSTASARAAWSPWRTRPDRAGAG